MFPFELGWLSIASALFFTALYLAGLGVQKVAAWSKRGEQPKDRVGFFLIIFAIIGFIAGSMLQPKWDKGMSCKQAGKPVISCVFFSQ